MKIVLTFMYKEKRYNIAVQSTAIPACKDAFKVRIKIWDSKGNLVEEPCLVLIVNHIDYSLYNVKQLNKYSECSDYIADIDETIVHCDCYEDK